MPRFFKMMDDLHVPGRWYPAKPVDRYGNEIELDLMRGLPVQVGGPIRIRHSEFAPKGRAIDYSHLNGAIVPLVHVRVAAVLMELAPADVQILAVECEGEPDQFALVNVLQVVKCIDDAASAEVTYFTEEDGPEFKDQVGEYMSVGGMRIDATKPGEARIFRPWGWTVAIIVHEEIKQALERIGTVGVRFREV
jgi:hypothetical protein